MKSEIKKIVFFGTHDFGAEILAALLSAKKYTVSAVVTQPDRPIGRNQEVAKSPVKLLAEQRTLPVFQPESLKKNPPTLPEADIFVVCQYGLIIPKTILDLPAHGTINVHTSLLPKYRGASPIQTALINGDSETGVTIMVMDEQMDHGPILAQEKIAIDDNDTYPTLSKKMVPVAGKLLIQTIEDLSQGTVAPVAQDENQATLCSLLTREDGKIDFNQTARQIYNRYRGTFPWPGIWTTWNGKRLKLLRVNTHNQPSALGIVSVENSKLFVGCAEGAIELLELQLEGKKPVSAAAFLQGNQAIVDARLGEHYASP